MLSSRQYVFKLTSWNVYQNLDMLALWRWLMLSSIKLGTNDLTLEDLDLWFCLKVSSSILSWTDTRVKVDDTLLVLSWNWKIGHVCLTGQKLEMKWKTKELWGFYNLVPWQTCLLTKWILSCPVPCPSLPFFLSARDKKSKQTEFVIWFEFLMHFEYSKVYRS